MLKDKSAYATDNAYARAFFLHKSNVQDYLVDPAYGSHIRVLTPHKDQPESENGKGYWNRKQFCIINGNGASRMLEMDAMEGLLNGVNMLLANLDQAGKIDVSFGGTDKRRPVLFTGDMGNIKFTTMDGMENFVVGPARVATERFTPERYKTILTNLRNNMQRIIAGEDPQEKILKLDGEVFTVLTRKDQGVRTPVRISAIRAKAPGITTIRIGTARQLICLPIDEAAEVFDKYIKNAKEISERILAAKSPAGFGEVKFNNGSPDTDMEYVNARIIPFQSGDSAFIILNSDRYPGNTKLGFHYDSEFCDLLNERFQEVTQIMKDMINEQANSRTDSGSL